MAPARQSSVPKRVLAWDYLLLVVVVFAGAAYSGAFQRANLFLYDGLLFASDSAERVEETIVLVEDRDELISRTPEKLEDFVRFLRGEGAAVIAFDRVPEAPESFFAFCAQITGKTGLAPVVFGRTMSRARAGEMEFKPLPPEAENWAQRLDLAPAFLPDLERGNRDGIWRWHQGNLFLKPDRKKLGVSGLDATLESVVLARYADGGHTLARQLPDGAFGVRFRSGDEPAAMLDLGRLLNRDLPAGLLQDRIVLVGSAPADRNAGAGIRVPHGEQGISPLQFRGAVLESLIEGSFVRIVPFWVWLGVVLGLPFLFLACYRRGRIISFLYMSLAITLMILGASWAVLEFFDCWFAPTELVLAQAMLGLHQTVIRQRERTESLRDLFVDTYLRMQDRLDSNSFLTDPEPWAHVHNVLSQSLCLESAVYLAPDVADASQLRIAHVPVRSRLSDWLQKQKLSPKQSPFRFALRRAEPAEWRDALLVEGPVWTIGFVRRRQIFGFLVFTLSDEEREQLGGFEGMLASYRERISDMLAHREVWRAQALETTSVRESDLSRETELHRGVEKSVGLMEGQLAQLHAILDSTLTARAVFDEFGRVVHCNRVMKELFSSEPVWDEESSCADLVRVVCGFEDLEARRLLRYVTMERGTARIKVDLSSHRVYMAHLRPLERLEEVGSKSRDAQGMAGVILELIDITDLERVAEQKDVFFQRLYYKLNNDLEAMLLSASLITDQRLDEAKRLSLVSAIKAQMDSTGVHMKEMREHFRQEAGEESVECLPTDPRNVLLTALEKVRPVVEEKRLQIQQDFPEWINLVLAAPGELESFFENLLQLLVKDAFSEGAVRIAVQQNAETVVLSFQNQGVGLPQDRLNQYLEDGNTGQMDELRRLAEHLSRLSRWKAVLEAASEVGVGLHFTLRMRAVI